MAHLSVRELPLELDQALRKEANKRNSSKTEVVLEALKVFFNLAPKKKSPRNLKNFFGKMTKKEFKEFQKVTSDLNNIEENLWK